MAWGCDLGVDEAELVSSSRGDRGVGNGQHGDAVLVAVAHVTDVDLRGGEVNDVAGGLAVLEEQVTQAGVGEGGREVVLRGHGHGFQGDRARGAAVGDQSLLGAVDQLPVDQGVADVEGYRLEATGIGQQLEAIGVAVLEDDRRGLVGVGGGGSCGIGRGVVDAGEGEIDGGDFTDRAVESEGAAGTGHFVQHTIDVVVDGDAGEAGAHRCVGDADASSHGLAKAACLECFAVSRGGGNGAGTGELNAEGTFNASVGEQLLGCTEVGANEIAAHHIALQRSDVEVTHEHGVGPIRNRIGAVGGFGLNQDETLA